MKNNLELKPIIKRVCAYLIDILLIMIFATIISNIKFINNKYQKYQEKYQEFSNIYQEYLELNKLLEKSYEDKEITKEEYEKLIENETYKSIFEEEYQDEKIEASEYKNIQKKINSKYTTIAKEYDYQLQKLGTYNTILTIACTFIYFVIIQYLLKGQTIGKKILGIKIVSSNDKKLTILTYTLRSLIINNIFLNTINLVFLNYTNKNTFNTANTIIDFLISFIEAVTIFLIITREDHRGIHDLCCHTKVISTKE